MNRRRRARAQAPRPPEPFDRERAFVRFRRLVGRAVSFGFVPYGPVVSADTPDELRREVELAIAAEGGRQRPS